MPVWLGNYVLPLNETEINEHEIQIYNFSEPVEYYGTIDPQQFSEMWVSSG